MAFNNPEVKSMQFFWPVAKIILLDYKGDDARVLLGTVTVRYFEHEKDMATTLCT